MSETVTPQREPTSKGGMGFFGWLMLFGMVILLIPLLPIYAVLKLYELIAGDSGPRE
jgi:hypothetical protein